jgi:ParB family chromosome partitioning protein
MNRFSMTKKVLGRGLGAYFPGMDDDDDPGGASLPPKERVNTILQVDINAVEVNPHQPRSDFEEESLRELADSIAQHGLIQPVTVRYISPAEDDSGKERLELISGERRLRAARMAGLDKLPAFVRQANDEQMIVFGIIENIQREQLNPVDVAMGYRRLMEECRLTQQEVAERVGKNRSTITNMLRLLHLPAIIQQGLKSGLITAGHARALLGVENEAEQEELFEKTVGKKLSVRELEQLVQLIGNNPASDRKTAARTKPKEILPDIAHQLGSRLETGVKIHQKKKGGEIKITFSSKEELERLLKLFGQVDQSNKGG